MPRYFPRLQFLYLACFVLPASFVFGQRAEKVRDYVQRHQHLAIEQMIAHGIPASVTMAQAIFESDCGSSALARRSNNHFGIKCHLQWGGDTVVKSDDAADECFRRYSSVTESYLDHSLFLRSRPRYAPLFALARNDYRGWCTGLKQCGYATFQGYADELITIIETFRLYELDEAPALARLSVPGLRPECRQGLVSHTLPVLFDFAVSGMLALDEQEIHVRSLDLVISAGDERSLLADKRKERKGQ